MEKNLLLINVLDEESYKDCHIQGSINIPLAYLTKAIISFDKNTTIILYCGSAQCDLSRKAWYALHKLGFINVMVYEGGMREWKESNLPSQGSCVADYLKPTQDRISPDKSIKTISMEKLSHILR